MLIKYMCKSMGLICSFAITGKSLEDVTDKAFEHVLGKHAGEFTGLTTPKEIELTKQALARSTHVVNG
jgi:predicted small metal-binding protein